MTNRLYKSIPAPKVPRNLFDRSRPCSLTLHFQKACPTFFEEIIPGDLYRVGTETFARLQPLIAPVMNNMKISQHFFFVPLRTLNKHFAEFMFNNRTGDYSEVLPYTNTKVIFNLVSDLNGDHEDDLAAEVIRLLDYLGLPFRYTSKTDASTFVTSWISDSWNVAVKNSALRVNLLPFFAYTKVWSEYFRDENVEEDPFVEFEGETSIDPFALTGDQSLTIATDYLYFAKFLMRLRPRAWAHDRFTSSLPFAQRGPDVLLPIAGQADVSYKSGYLLGDVTDKAPGFVTAQGNPSAEVKGAVRLGTVSSGGSTRSVNAVNPDQAAHSASLGAYDPDGSLEVDFDNAALTTTINSFRRAERLQRWYENSARGGVRPNEATLAHFGVRTPDSTLDRAEFLGGSMQPIVVSEVAQTSETTAASPQGTLAGKGTTYKGTAAFRAYFTEHGYVIGLTSALVRANYWQGIPKYFSRMQRDEYYWPEFANLGEEPVFTKELFAGTNVNEDTVFGYVPRYSDYKSETGSIHGDMRSSLAFWTQAREFANLPQLNKEFLFGPAPLTPFAVQSQYTDPIIATIQFSVKASRLMPFYGVPTI